MSFGTTTASPTAHQQLLAEIEELSKHSSFCNRLFLPDPLSHPVHVYSDEVLGLNSGKPWIEDLDKWTDRVVEALVYQSDTTEWLRDDHKTLLTAGNALDQIAILYLLSKFRDTTTGTSQWNSLASSRARGDLRKRLMDGYASIVEATTAIASEAETIRGSPSGWTEGKARCPNVADLMKADPPSAHAQRLRESGKALGTDLNDSVRVLLEQGLREKFCVRKLPVDY